MCARYELKIPRAKALQRKLMEALLDVIWRVEEVRPTDRAPVVLGSGKVETMRWGLAVPWSPRPLINARRETLHAKETFRALRNQRCLVPVSAYFEWLKQEARRLKHRVAMPGTDLFCLAGLFNDAGEFTVVTTSARPEIRHIHDRMPLVLAEEGEAAWLEGVEVPDPVRPLEARPVPANDGGQPDLFSALG